VISHVVLFRPRATLSTGERAALIESLKAAVIDIASIKRTTIGKRILLNRPGYETQMAEHFEYSAILEFGSEADLREYLDHPAHTNLGRLLFTAADAVLAYDFVSTSLADLT
jgi:Stress responsive A/B Barrel Domain